MAALFLVVLHTTRGADQCDAAGPRKDCGTSVGIRSCTEMTEVVLMSLMALTKSLRSEQCTCYNFCLPHYIEFPSSARYREWQCMPMWSGILDKHCVAGYGGIKPSETARPKAAATYQRPPRQAQRL